MIFNFDQMTGPERYRLLVGAVMPRPIALVTSINGHGVVNAAPFSFFNVFGADPALVALGVSDLNEGVMKDTRKNILESQEFVVNLVSYAIAEKMNITAIPFPPDVDELKQAGFTAQPSEFVKPPCVLESPVSLECRLLQHLPFATFGLILGQVHRMHVHDEAVKDAARLFLNAEKLDLIGRMEGSFYSRTTERFDLMRPTLEDWAKKNSEG